MQRPVRMDEPDHPLAFVINYHFAGLMLATEAMIAELADEKGDGGMGGMGMGM